MAKKALCVGINDYPYEGADLFGCVNDAQAWAELLRDHYGFPENRITMVTDRDATKAEILMELDNLLADAQAGDVLVYTFSGHGTYVADVSGDEPGFDEGQCAYDGVILDDELRERLVALPDDVHLTVISDSCHSGSVTRGEDAPHRERPDQRRERFLNPELLGNVLLSSSTFAAIKRQMRQAMAAVNELTLRFKMNELLLAGCMANQSSYDALFGDVHHGAMTFHALQTIKEMNYELTYEELYDELSYRLEDAGFPQNPQLEGGRSNRNRQLFT